MHDLTELLKRELEGRSVQMGEVIVRPIEGGYAISHAHDAESADVAVHTSAHEARTIAQNDAAGEFRGLKTAPTLRTGWRLELSSMAEVRAALDYIYPGMLGVWRAHLEGELQPVNLRQTLDRQTGMYAITRKITDEQAQSMIGGFCEPDGGCIKTILWGISEGVALTELPTRKLVPGPGIPLFCHEACNFLVAKAREVVKKQKCD